MGDQSKSSSSIMKMQYVALLVFLASIDISWQAHHLHHSPSTTPPPRYHHPPPTTPPPRYHQPQPICKQVPKEVCKKVPKQVYESVTKQKCRDVPEEICTQAEAQKCKIRQKPIQEYTN